MLALNDAVSAFAIGELKNRRLDGGVIEEVDSDVSDDDDKSGEDDSDQGKDYEQLPEEDQSDLDGGEEELEGGRARQQPPSDVEEESMEF